MLLYGNFDQVGVAYWTLSSIFIDNSTDNLLFQAVYYAHLRMQEGENSTSVASVPHTPVGQDGKPIILPSSFGETLELCAGIVDKVGKTLEEIAAEELYEECGYRVEPSRLRKITTVS